ncbi:MAG: T9SS type A sorting domain-containing protein, partial [Emticicia sp.]|uniref:T9SS type A sorting domain-containing protein n=1 Tax=Emticicia sp. TaxID=1930953 RepID=UPI003BA762B3
AATCSLNNCVSALSASATVTVASGGTPVAPPLISGTATICNGQSTVLSATNCAGVVSWSNGMTGTSISVNPSASTDYTATCFDGTCTSNNSNIITVTVNAYPSITTHPKNDADCNGNSVSFSVTASSVSGYQWQRKVPNGTFMDIPNAISNTLTVSNVGSSTDPNQTEYRVVLSNGTCSVTSTAAVLTVNSVVGSLADQTICDGANASFNLNNVVVSGNIQGYQWQKRIGTSGTWNDIAGATTTTLTINAATNADEQYYRCKVTFTAGSSTCARYTTEDDSNGAKLTVLVASTPNIGGTNAVCLGRSTTLTANNCDGTIAWSSGQTTPSITVSPTSNTSYTVSCTSSQCGFNVSSAPYLVTVNSTPQPEIITYDVISPATLTFAARITVPNATLMWYNRASGGTGTTTAPSFTAVGTYSYWVTQTNPITGCESARLPIIAKVLDYFRITQQPTNQVDCRGNSVFFGVVAVGPNPSFTYQWQRKRPNEPDFVNLVEEGNGIRGWYARTMAISNVGDDNNPNQTQYRCIISSGGQVLTSEISTLTVNSLTGSMPNLGICVGETNEFNLQNYFTITGNVLSYQWQTRPGTSGAWTNLSDGNGISGSTSSALKFIKATYEQGVYYRCLVKFNTQGFECTEPTDAAKLIVSGFPPAPSVSNVFYCQNSNAVRLKVDSPTQNLVWYSQETGGVGASTAPTPNTSIAGVFKYYVSDRTDEGCESPRAVINVEVGALPPAPKNTTITPINEGNVLTFSAEGTPVENQILRWYTSPTITTFSTTAPTFTTVGTYTRYVAQVSAFGCVGPRTGITATIIPSLKFTKQPLSQADCDGNSITFSITATAPSTFTYQWQRQKPNETSFIDIANETSASLKISDIGSNADPHLTKYRCVIKDDKNTAISEEAVLTVNAIAGILPTMSLCDGKVMKLSFSGLTVTGTVAAYQWQKKQGSSYIDIPTNTAGVAVINEIGTYRGKISFVVDKNTTCSRNTDDLKVEVKPTPVAPQVSNQNVCLNTPFDITKAVNVNNNLLWYESAIDTTADKTTPKVDVSKLGKVSYFVSQISAFGCESEQKSFDVVVSAIPEKPIISDLTYCRNAPSLALAATTSSQNQVVWYASLTAKDAFNQTPIPNTKLDGETVYFAAAKSVAGCESERVPLKVSVSPCIANFTNNFNNCLQVSADSVKGNQWFDLYDAAGRLYASVNPNGLNLGKVSISIRHYGRGSAAIPTTKNETKLMARYVDFQSSVLDEFPTPVSLRIYYLNEELSEYKTATNLPNLTINDFNIVHYDGVREDCGFENNDNFLEGNSYVIYKNVVGNQLAKDFFYLQFDVNEFSENAATANDFTEISFNGKETETQTVQLNWQSKFEVKAEKYILERSADCKNFVQIAEVKANGAASSYENTDFQPLAGKSCYRLVYIDKDGTKKYLDVIDVNFTSTTPICSVFPNPWNKGDEISLYLRNIKEKEIKLYDMLGQTYSFDMNQEASKIIKIRPDVHLSKGIHFLVVVGEDGKKCVQKVVINP